jgi:hypothetical protein
MKEVAVLRLVWALGGGKRGDRKFREDKLPKESTKNERALGLTGSSVSNKVWGQTPISTQRGRQRGNFRDFTFPKCLRKPQNGRDKLLNF